MKFIRLLLSVSLLALFSLANGQIFRDKSVYIISGVEFESTFLIKDSISVDSVNSDTIFYSLHRETIIGPGFPGNYLLCNLIEVQNRLFASVITIDGDTIPETLIYDFNLTIGDSFRVSIPSYSKELFTSINNILKVELMNGDSVNSQTFTDLGKYSRINKHLPIVGSNAGPLGLFQYILYDAINPNGIIKMNLVSCCDSDTLLYLNTELISDTINIDGCNSTDLINRLLASANEISENVLVLYPNPSSSKLYISGIDKRVKFEIYDSFGKAISSGFTSSSIDISELNEGLHFIEVHQNNGIWRSKFLKE